MSVFTFHARLPVVLAFLLLSTIRAAAQTPPTMEVTASVAADGAAAGSTIRAALEFKLSKGAHVNSNKPREEVLIPLEVTVDAPAGIDVRELVFPRPIDLKSAGSPLPLSVFEEEFVVGAELQVAADAKPGVLTVPVRIRYQACDEKMCYIPKRIETSWTLPVVAAGVRTRPLHRDLFSQIAFGTGEAPGAPKAVTSPALAPNVSSSGGAALDDYVVLGTSGAVGAAEFVQFIKNAEAGIKEKGLLEDRGVLAMLVIVFLGGLALNLTPCVLPMIPINLAIIGAGAKAGSRGRGFLLGATYGAAMALVYGVLGVVVILTAGTFGTLNSSPWFNLGIAVLFVVLALAMFDVIVIDFSRFSSSMKLGATGRGTFLLSFVMGAVAALLAGACVAPIVIQVVVLASNLYSTGSPAALALPFVLGLGMALPWPIAGAGIAALPRPGAWMERVKYAFGIFVLGTAAYYAYQAYSIYDNRRADPAAVARSVEEQLKAGWHASLDEGLSVAARENKPVLIDMWASWCKNCLVMDATTLKDPAVLGALSNYVKIKFQAESPDESPAKEVMSRFEAVGLPTYVILKHK